MNQMHIDLPQEDGSTFRSQNWMSGNVELVKDHEIANIVTTAAKRAAWGVMLKPQGNSIDDAAFGQVAALKGHMPPVVYEENPTHRALGTTGFGGNANTMSKSYIAAIGFSAVVVHSSYGVFSNGTGV